jgi:hypothetical protein
VLSVVRSSRLLRSGRQPQADALAPVRGAVAPAPRPGQMRDRLLAWVKSPCYAVGADT